MNSTLLWSLIGAQIVMGLFDTLYHHELTERLAWRPTQKRELELHGARNLIYAVLFAVLGWSEVRGVLAIAVLALLVAELFITLADFVAEDASRKLPATERVTHTLLALNYGAILAVLLPLLLGWAGEETALRPAWHGQFSVLAGLASLGTVFFGIRDLHAAHRTHCFIQPPTRALAAGLGAPRTVLVTGATGFIGRRLVEALGQAHHRVIVLTRDPAKALGLRPPFWLITDLDQIPADTRIDAIVNLAGEPISDGLWTRARRRKLIGSRVEMTAAVVKLIARLAHRPQVLVNGSAIGWYGLRGDEILLETSEGRDCFSHALCAAWENEANKARALNVRVVLLRIGLVLGTEGGMLSRLLTPFEFFLGGRIGSGRQWMSWITRDDLVRLIAHAIATSDLCGVVNATAPVPVQNRTFAKELARALHRPALLPLPAAPLRWLAGDFANELLLSGQRVLPRKAVTHGFAFTAPTLPEAFATIFGNTDGGMELGAGGMTACAVQAGRSVLWHRKRHL
jgi:uncharacterized protein (TIGR01777 family)